MALSKSKRIELLDSELQQTKSSLKDYVVKTADTIDNLERMISREHGSTATYDTLIRDYNRIGDPYFHNIFIRKSIDKRSDNIAGVDFRILDASGNEITSGPVVDLFNYINEDDSYYDFIFDINRSMDRFGKCFIVFSDEKRRDGVTPQIMYTIPADKVKAVTVSGLLSYWEYTEGKKKIKLDPEKVLFIKYKHPDDNYDGLAPGSSAVKEILQDFYAQAYNIKYFQQGAQGKGLFRSRDGVNLTPQQRDEAQFAVDQTYNQGLDSAHRDLVAVRGDLEWVRTSDSQRDMEFQKLLDKMRDDILVVYDIPKVLFTSADSTFTNLKEAKKLFWNQTLMPIMKKIEDAFNTNFFGKMGMPYTFEFKTDEIPELGEDINDKIDSAQKLYSMNVPVSVINEVLGLGLPEEGWEGWDQPTALPQLFDVQPEEIKQIDYHKEFQIQEEKRINNDDFYMNMEYQKSLSVMLNYEKQIGKEVKEFFDDKFKEIEDYQSTNEIKSVAKDLVDPNWIERFVYWLRNKDWSEDFVSKLRPVIETVFNRGVYRTYWGVGANFELSNQRALDYIINRGLKLKGSPQIVQDTIIDMMESETFTIDQMSKAIADKWQGATIARAKVVSITESTAAYNGGRVVGMKELGIKKKQWVHSSDAKVRDSHRIRSIIPVDEEFVLADGYKTPYPGAGNPEHACNCRCVVVSVLD